MKTLLFATLGSAVTLLLQLSSGWLGPAGVVLNLLVPLPAALLTMLAGSIPGAGVVAATALVLWLVGSPGFALGYLLQFGLGSLLLPWFLRRGWGWDRAVLVTVVAVVAAAGIFLAGYAGFQGQPIGGLVGEYVQGEITRSIALYQEADLPEEQVAELRQFADQMAGLLLKAYPGLAVVATGVLQLLTVLLLFRLNQGRYVMTGPAFHAWKAPDMLIWGLIAGGFGVFFGAEPLQMVALNLLTVLLPVYFLHGLAILTFFFRKKGIAPGFRAVGYVMVTLLSPLPLIVTGMGVFDLWADFRKPRIKKT
ncbi:hypothetical protein DESUT3_29850 [Desulfuromonas versatilis]|uniref:DUF2232 domain-containing protein n=1 Tax=Desulfuromonas versatilis TaxID=2802975 RepID=A0ABN6E0U2_9BACT|nr:DUF2232 domain-containing protein [Desulfuromonas versatilis]BCR05916.1 hypothetical protein DESUT3_29850 [Desulfuromonas versatilis]